MVIGDFSQNNAKFSYHLYLTYPLRMLPIWILFRHFG